MNTKSHLITDPVASSERAHRYLGIFGMVWISFLILSMFSTIKTFNVFGFTFVAGTLGYPVTYVFSDIFTEVYGYRVSRRIVWSGLFCAMTVSLIAMLYTYLPSSVYTAPEVNSAFNTIFRLSPLVALATLLGFLSGEFTNSFVLAKLKMKTKGRFAEFRYIASTLFGQLLDNAVAVVVIIAFSNIFTLKEGIEAGITTVVFCTLWELMMTPVTRRFIRFVKDREGIDTYDYGTNFNPFKVLEK